MYDCHAPELCQKAEPRLITRIPGANRNTDFS